MNAEMMVEWEEYSRNQECSKAKPRVLSLGNNEKG